MQKNYIKAIIRIFPNIARGRKNFEYFERRIIKNLLLTKKYKRKKLLDKNDKSI